MWHMHTPTFNKWQQKKKKKNKKVTLHILTHGAMWGCRLTSLVICINDKIHDIRERNVTIRSEIWTTNIRSLGFRDIREQVTLWGWILRSLGCNKLTLGQFTPWTMKSAHGRWPFFMGQLPWSDSLSYVLSFSTKAPFLPFPPQNLLDHVNE